MGDFTTSVTYAVYLVEGLFTTVCIKCDLPTKTIPEKSYKFIFHNLFLTCLFKFILKI